MRAVLPGGPFMTEADAVGLYPPNVAAASALSNCNMTQAYGGEMYRLVKAVRQANDLLVDRLAERLPLSTPLVPPTSSDAPVWRVGNQHSRRQEGDPPCP